MDFCIADTFTDALARLPAQEQKAVKTSAFDLQLDPSSPGLSFHRIDSSKDLNFWSVRVNRDIRLIVHKTAESLLLAYVDHHDKAYAWAERRRIEAHPRTGAVQIVEARERVEETAPALFRPRPTAATAEPSLFARLSPDDLLSVGVPEDWVEPVRAATEARFFDLAAHLPAEAAEALLGYAAEGVLKRPSPPSPAANPFAHPDALRRFRVIEDVEELRAALDAPWDKWSVFLHPSQRALVARDFDGPARVAGSAGTGKTVVALHRAARLLREDPSAKVLLTTFSQPLADALRRKFATLSGPEGSMAPRLTVLPFRGAAEELFQLAFGRRPRVIPDDRLREVLTRAAEGTSFTPRFLVSEWIHVIDAWQVPDAAAYAEVPRLGRRNRLGARQRERLWPVIEAARAALKKQNVTTWPEVFGAVTAFYRDRIEKPFTHVVVDEAQDLGVPELRFLAAITSGGANALFFAGDLGQRIFQQPYSWKALGVDLRGRSATLKVNYRTSHQIRIAADRLLPAAVRDVDGREEERRGTVSMFDGPAPDVVLLADAEAEAARVGAFLRAAAEGGVTPGELGVFVRSRSELSRARSAAEAAGFETVELTERGVDPAGRVSVGTMHLAKGLEFKAVAVMACDEGVLPLQARVDAVVDEADLDDVFDTERQLFYVACTRARDRLLVTGVTPGSEFLGDL